MVGDGEAETGPLAGSWQGDQLPQPGARWRGAADPAPQRLQDRRPHRAGPRQRRRRARATRGHGYEVHFVEGDDPRAVHQAFAATLDTCYARIRAIQQERAQRTASRRARAGRRSSCARPRAGPGPKVVDGVPVEGTFRAHQVPLADVRDEPGATRAARSLAAQLPAGRAVRRERAADPGAGRAGAARATGAWAPTRTPTAASCWWTSTCPTSATMRSTVPQPATERARVHAPARQAAARHLHPERAAGQLPPLLPRRDQLQPAGQRLRGREPLLRGHDHLDRRPRLARRAG